MNGEIKTTDYQGQPWAVVRDIHGTRVGVRNVPRGHQVVLLVMVTADPDSDHLTIYRAGEGVPLDDVVEAALVARLTRLTAENFGYGFTVNVHVGEGGETECTC